MRYKKLNLELIVMADEADSVINGLNGALDRLEDTHTLFGGAIEINDVQSPKKEKRSALAHTRAAGTTAIRAVRGGLNVAFRAVV